MSIKRLSIIIAFAVIVIGTPLYAREMHILVYPFENIGDKQYSWIGAGMTETVISDLTRIKGIGVVTNQDRRKAIKEIELGMTGLIDEQKAVKAGQMTGANVIFTGTYMVSGRNIRVNARLIEVETSKVEKSTKLDGDVDRIFDLQDKVVIGLMTEAEKVNIADVKPKKLTDKDIKTIQTKWKPKRQAYELYAKGLDVQNTNPKQALAYFKQALAMEPEYIDALLTAGYTSGNTLNLFDEARTYLSQADSVLIKRKETETIYYAQLMMLIGSVYWSKGQPDKALDYYQKEMNIRDRLSLKNTAGYANLMMNIGNAYWRKGQLDNALRFFFKAKNIHDRLSLHNTAEYAALLINIGLGYWGKGQLDNAMEYYLKAKDVLERLSLYNMKEYSALMNNIGLIYYGKSQFDDALEYYLKSKDVRDRLSLQNTDGYANLMMNIGIVYCNKDQFDDALKYFQKSKDIRDRLSLQKTMGYAQLLNNFAYVYEKQGNKPLAGKYYRKAYNTFVEAGYTGKLKGMADIGARRCGY